MIKKFLKLATLTIILFGIYLPISTDAQTVRVDPTAPINPTSCPGDQVLAGNPPTCVSRANLNNPRPTTGADLASSAGGVFSDWIVGPLFKAIGYLLMTLSGGILTMIGSLFDFIVKYTIIDMAQNIGNESVGGSIRDAWRALRDIANMFFIFVLLYVAFKAVFDLNFGNVGKAISNIIIVALLINFSLFFSKVVIDASNIAAVGFYNSIITANSRSVSGESTPSGNQTISSGYMRLLGLQSWYSPNILIAPSSITPDKILIVGIFSSVFMLITAVIFLISTVVFAARFIILVFLMILSPLALVAIVIPGMNGYFDKWKDALINQSIFAPIFFALTWVVFKIGSAPGFLGQLGGSAAGASAEYIDLITKSPSSSMGLVLNYVLVIGFSIAALVISKQIASKAPFFTAISGGIGAGAIGGAAFLGRQTIGRAGKYFADKAGLQKAANEGTGVTGAGARLALYASKQARGASFDARNAAVPTSVIGDLVQGTVGRTKIGKKIGLDDVNIQNVDIAGRLGKDIVGAGGTKGYKELKEESDKRVRTREAEAKSEFKLVQAKEDVVKGAKAPAGTTGPLIDAMEKSLSNLSDKETETLVASNRELLESQNFANAISAKQLEAIIKSDQFSEAEKGKFKDARFSEINTAMNTTGPGRSAAISSVKGKIKTLTDSELEMINVDYLKDEEFVKELRSAQIETIGKSNKFTSSDKEKFRETRRKPLENALRTGNLANAKTAIKSLGIKEVASLDLRTILMDPTMLQVYNPQILKRLAQEMNPSDIPILRARIITGGDPATIAWLSSNPDNFA